MMETLDALLEWTTRRAGYALARPRLERAIGVVYKTAIERASHCFRARLGDQFDAVIHAVRIRDGGDLLDADLHLPAQVERLAIEWLHRHVR